MNFLISFFKVVLYQPLLNLLVLLYVYMPGHDFGLAIILLTIIVRLALFPLSKKAVKSQKQMAELQPKIQKIREQHKHDKQQQAQAMMKLYKEGDVSPAAGCLPLLLQFPILIALYQVFLKGLTPEALKSSLYGFVPYLGQIKTMFLGVFDLSRSFWYTANGATHYYWPALVLAIITGGVQFWQMKMSMASSQKEQPLNKKDSSQVAAMMQSQMMYFMPLLLVFIVAKFGSIIGLYLLVSTLFSIGEYYFINSKSENQNANVSINELTN